MSKIITFDEIMQAACSMVGYDLNPLDEIERTYAMAMDAMRKGNEIEEEIQNRYSNVLHRAVGYLKIQGFTYDHDAGTWIKCTGTAPLPHIQPRASKAKEAKTKTAPAKTAPAKSKSASKSAKKS